MCVYVSFNVLFDVTVFFFQIALLLSPQVGFLPRRLCLLSRHQLIEPMRYHDILLVVCF